MWKESEVWFVFCFFPSWDLSCKLEYVRKIEFEYHISDFLLEGFQTLGKSCIVSGFIGEENTNYRSTSCGLIFRVNLHAMLTFRIEHILLKIHPDPEVHFYSPKLE